MGPVLETRRTHISEVWLTADRAFKRKRPVSLGFVDYGTRELRRAACEAEVRLNRRLAPDVYLGVVACEDGEPAVEMRRLADEDSALARLERGALHPAVVRAIGEAIGRFHTTCATSPEIATHGSWARLDHHLRENFDQTRTHCGALVDPEVHVRCEVATHQGLARHAARIAGRAARVVDGHGDLRLEHVYVRGGVLEIIDCVEFSDAYRCSDTVMDLAFLWMDLAVRGEDGLAAALVDGWLQVTGDADGLELLRFFGAYRSIVRAKVAGFTLADPSLSSARRSALVARARRHWTWALRQLDPVRGPALIGVGGRPGTGKTTVARRFEEAGAVLVRSDVVRKELAGAASTDRLADAAYSDDARDRVYDACFERAEEALFRGRAVVVDATFTRESWRAKLLDLGRRVGVPVRLLRCEAPDAVVRERLAHRAGDASDADFSVYLASVWEPESPAVAAVLRVVRTDLPLPEDLLDR